MMEFDGDMCCRKDIARLMSVLLFQDGIGMDVPGLLFLFFL